MTNKLLLAAAASAALSTTAMAADLPGRYAPPPPYVALPTFTWSGFYAGTLTGYAFSDQPNVTTVGNNGAGAGVTNTQLNVALLRRPPSLRLKQEGLTSIGGGIGYDWQFTPGNGFVVGVAADATLMDLERRRGYVSPAQVANAFTPEISGFRQSLDWLGTIRGRVGYGYDRFLVYGTGGFAFGGTEDRAAFLRNTDGALVYFGRRSGTDTGFVYGGGLEYAFPTDSIFNKFNLLSYVGITSQALTVKVEYLRYDLGSHNIVVNNTGLAGGPTGSYTSRFSTEGNLIRGGFTYRFGSL